MLEKKGDFVNLNLINTNDGSVFERKEMKNVELKWNLLQNHDQKEESELEASDILDLGFYLIPNSSRTNW